MQTTENATPEVLRRNYEYIRILGEGANGRTWLAKDLRTGAEVAVKELKVFDDFKQVELFARESEVLRSLDIRGVPKFYRSVAPEVATASGYLVQEYVPHPSLQRMLDEGHRFTESEVLGILYEVGRILYELQNRYAPPVLHRDIKASNILYDGTRVWLIDFGAVANARVRSEGSTVAGTFGYMAPEQLMGDACEQSDFYALGATAVQLLTGIAPHEMECDVFRICLEPVFARAGVVVSAHCMALLEGLLSPDVSGRPASAVELERWVYNVREGRPPREDAAPKRGFFGRLWARFRNWNTLIKQAEGQIQSVRALRGRIYLEYTFEDVQSGFSQQGYAEVCPDALRIEPQGALTLSTGDKVGLLVADRCVVSYWEDRPWTSWVVNQTVYLSDALYRMIPASCRAAAT